MDRIRIYAMKKIIDSKILDEKQHYLALEQLIRKCTVFGKGCLKHGKRESGTYYLELAESYKGLYEKGYLSGEKEEKVSG